MTTHISVFTEYRGYLFSLAQRVLGSRADAEDLLQETFIRWQQTSLAQIRSPKAFLATVICRQLLRRAHKHVADARARFEVSPEQLQKLARQFAITCASGDLKGLVTALA